MIFTFPKLIFSWIAEGDTVLINGERYSVYRYAKDGFNIVGLARNQAEFDKVVQEIISVYAVEGEEEDT